jgi:hypothetical protein
VAAWEPVGGSLALVGARKPVEWLFWAGKDAGHRLRYGADRREFGIVGFCGEFGAGKTVGMVERAARKKRRWGDKLKIYSNVPVAFADGPLHSPDQIKEHHESGENAIFLIDEIHLTWDQMGWKDVDPDFMKALTQQRKYGGGFAIYFTTQVLAQTAIMFRRLAQQIVDCHGWPTSRWIHETCYRGIAEYNEGMPRLNPMSGKDMRNVAWRYSFIASDALRFMYDTTWVAADLASGAVPRIGARAVREKIALEAKGAHELLGRQNALVTGAALAGATAGAQAPRGRPGR